MKEILQTKYLNHKINLACAYSHMFAYSCILHVENVDQEYVDVEEGAAAGDQEGQQLQELEAVDQVEEQDPSDFTNSDQQPGKHRKHLTQRHLYIYIYLSFSHTLCYLLVH